jgi:L-rhamnose isomerase/sugar isomerase
MSAKTLPEVIARSNALVREALEEDYAHLGRQLARRGIDIEQMVARAAAFRVAIPSWGVGTGGTRFARFPERGEPRTLLEKLDDCAVVQALVRITPGISLHIPWDKPRENGPGDLASIRARLLELGLSIDSMNSNTFQDQPGQPLSYKFGSLSHTDAAVRRQAIEHNLECLAIGQALGASSHTVWIGDGGNFPGQIHFRRALDRYVDSLQAIYAQLPERWRLFIEHKFYEPAFYSTVLNDWGTSYLCARAVGDRCLSLVDLGHHAPNVNIEQIVAQLIRLGGLGGFHFNDSKFGDDDLDAGSIKPFQLFLIFNELVDAELEGVPGFAPAYMLDQSHNVTDPLESLMSSAMEVVRAYVQAHLVDRAALAAMQEGNDPLWTLQLLKQAFTTDVSPILAMARLRAGGAIDPITAYRLSFYREKVAAERPATATRGSGIV